MKGKKNQTSIGKWDEILDNYLLGKLSDEEKKAFEEQCFENDALFDELKFREQVFGLVEKEREILFADYLKQKRTPKRPNRNIVQVFEFSLPSWMSYSLKVAIPIFVLFSLYGIARLGWPLFLPKSYMQADISSFDFYLAEHRSRTPETESDFRKGFETLFNAHRSSLGLFPHYDRTQVELALNQLVPCFEAATEDSDRAKIAFFIGKAYLMNEDVPSACRWFQRVIDENAEAFFVVEVNKLLKIFECR